MPSKSGQGLGSILRNIPSVDEILRTEAATALIPDVGILKLTRIVRDVLDEMRREISTRSEENAIEPKVLLTEIEIRLRSRWKIERSARVQRVINASGVVLHTNLGRAPLSPAARKSVSEVSGYSTVEYDLISGGRGKRGAAVESLICELTGAEAAIVVNNCAAAAHLILTVFAAGGEVIVSRGELVEIGGDFRVPDILTGSGARLREVGTTNRTKIEDYEKAIGNDTKVILKVHPSNYRIIGFSSSVGLDKLAAFSSKNGLILYEDAGSGALTDLSSIGLTDEPVISRSIADGADLVSFSGDKLAGGPQAGMIAGRSELIERLRKHPLYRVLRVDKLIYAALDATLHSFQTGRELEEIPVLKMLAASRNEIEERCRHFIARVDPKNRIEIRLVEGRSAVGGGAAPDVHPETVLISLVREETSADKLESLLRRAAPPVIARIAYGMLLLDLRTVGEDEEQELARIISNI